MDRIRAWLLPKGPGRPPGVPEEELRELRLAALKPSSKKDGLNSLKIFDRLDAGGAPGFSGMGLFFGDLYLAWNGLVAQTLAFGALLTVVYFGVILAYGGYHPLIALFSFVPLWVAVGFLSRRWIWESPGRIVNAALASSGGDPVAARKEAARLRKGKGTRARLAFVAVLVVWVSCWLFYYSRIPCNDYDVRQVLDRLIVQTSAQKYGKSEAEISQLIDIRVTDVTKVEREGTVCLCSATLTVSPKGSMAGRESTDIQFEVDSTESFDTEFMVKLYGANL
jgi:hypothetical protein